MAMKIKCKIDGHSCELPDAMVDFFVHTTVIYCSTLTPKNRPHIHPVLFSNEPNSCVITFLLYKQSVIAKNLINNPNISLAIDITHPINPFWNRGISIKGNANLFGKIEELETGFSYLEEKYGLSTVTKILGIDKLQESVRVRVHPLKIVYWKGPYFKRFKCKSRRKTSQTFKIP
jgi:hypothetical protein